MWRRMKRRKDIAYLYGSFLIYIFKMAKKFQTKMDVVYVILYKFLLRKVRRNP